MTIPSRPADTGHYTHNSDHKWINLLRKVNPDQNDTLFAMFYNAAGKATNTDVRDELEEIAADLTEAHLIGHDETR